MNLLSVSVDLSILDIFIFLGVLAFELRVCICKAGTLPLELHIQSWIFPTTHSLLWLASFTEHNVVKNHPSCGMHQYCIPFYGLIFHSMKDTWIDITSKLFWMCCWEHLCTSFCTGIFLTTLEIHLAIEMQGHIASHCWLFEELPDYFPRWPYHFTFPSAMHVSLHPHKYMSYWL
jgi:hypothetical protein